MNTDFQILLILGLVGTAIVAAGPLFRLPQFRRVLAGIGGSGLMALGATTFGLIAGGVIEVPSLSSQASAQEPTLAEVDESAAKSSAEGSGASAAPTAEAPAASDPSLAPSVTIHIPAGRPSWTSAEPVTTGKDLDTIPVGSGPYKRLSDARRALDRAIEAATNEYIRNHLGDSQLAPQLLRYDVQQIKSRFVKRENLYEDAPNFPDSVGEMHECFALLEFTPEFRAELDHGWATVRSTSRMTQLGLFAGAALLLLASVFGYFRLDNATRGYYTGRLQFLTAAAILAVIGAGVFAAQWIHWL
jgi:hypothetical protein